MPEARNQRFLLANRTFRFKELSDFLRSHYGDAYPFKTEEIPECPENARFKLLWERVFQLDNSKSKEILGIEYIDMKDSLV